MVTIVQVAALPHRISSFGDVEILLVTSRDTGRWVLPKGNVERGEEPRAAVLREAAEEAGIWGSVASSPLGTYRYDKRLPDGSVRRIAVTVWPLAVQGIGEDWPEARQRERIWLAPEDAALAVEEKSLKRLLLKWRG
jgi:8-oxo-dGTP pyrophosphatase MutT (NUDIX family)